MPKAHFNLWPNMAFYHLFAHGVNEKRSVVYSSSPVADINSFLSAERAPNARGFRVLGWGGAS
jgi:hypothetical protein